MDAFVRTMRFLVASTRSPRDSAFRAGGGARAGPRASWYHRVGRPGPPARVFRRGQSSTRSFASRLPPLTPTPEKGVRRPGGADQQRSRGGRTAPHHDGGHRPMSDTDKAVLSQEALDALRAELEELKTNGRERMSHQLRQARELGDVTDNAAFETAKQHQALLEGRIARLQGVLKNAVVRRPTGGRVPPVV